MLSKTTCHTLIKNLYDKESLCCPSAYPHRFEQELNAYCAENGVSKSYVVQEVLGAWLAAVKERDEAAAQPPPEPDLSFLAPSDPLRKYVGIAQGGPSTDELMRLTRGDDWNRP